MDLSTPAPLSISSLILNLLIGMVLSSILSIYYVKYGSSLSNREKFAPILPMLTLITLLVISIVKSSLALSLGLVGALSIVRFRTAIKDPEELIFLFFAIAIGLGMGADQRIPTFAAFILIMLYISMRVLIQRNRRHAQSLYLNIQIPEVEGKSTPYAEINHILSNIVSSLDIRRMDSHDGKAQITYYFSANDQTKLTDIMDKLKITYPNASVSIIEQNNLLGG